jgi:Sec-independent protein translocase protein TatA
MNILGVGPTEFVLIVLIALIVAGPKRMIQWMYHLGRWTAKAREMWGEVVDAVQRELNESGVDVELPRELPTRHNVNQTVRKAFKPLSQPVEEAMNEVKQVQDTFKDTGHELKRETTGLQTDVRQAAERMQRDANHSPGQPNEIKVGGTWANVHGGSENGTRTDQNDDSGKSPRGFGTWAQYTDQDE